MLADLPGLIEGAAQGVGLGHEFLRHVERTRVLVHLVEPFPIGRLRPGEELPRHPQGAAPTTSSRSTDKPEVVCVSKAELTGAEEVQAKLAADLGREVLLISAVTGQGLATLVGRVSQMLAEIKRAEAEEAARKKPTEFADRAGDPHRGLPHDAPRRRAGRDARRGRGHRQLADEVGPVCATAAWRRWRRCRSTTRMRGPASRRVEADTASPSWAVASVNPPAVARFEEWATDRGGSGASTSTSFATSRSNVAVDEPEQSASTGCCARWPRTAWPIPIRPSVISVGTAVTVDLVDAKGVFQGGVIFPGPRLMAESLHDHTAKLPLVDAAILPRIDRAGQEHRRRDPGRHSLRRSLEPAVLLANHYADIAPLRRGSSSPAGRRATLGQLHFGQAVRRDSFRSRRSPSKASASRRRRCRDARVAVLTPPGTGAIATVEVSGPRAWELARELFRPAGKPLPAEPDSHRFWFGTLGGR